LRTRNGDATWVPTWLQHLHDRPRDFAHLSDGWPALSSENTTWSAAYAAMPHLVQIASRVQAAERFEYVVALGFIVRDQVSGDPFGPMGLRPYLAEGFRAAIEPALRLAAEVVGLPQPGERELRYVLMAVSALQGYQVLAECIDRLDDDEVCPPYAESLAG
jgi:hypothetical protein